MKILIQTKNLIDFPYEPAYEPLFAFDEEKVEALVSELLFAGPTCYLVSGYRGAGKTSFLKRVQQRCAAEQSRLNLEQKWIFVHSNFSRFENRTNFLRKIIRDLRETLVKLQTTQLKADQKAVGETDIELLFKQTFFQVRQEFSRTRQQEQMTEVNVSVHALIKKILTALLPVGFSLTSLLANTVWVPAVVLSVGVLASLFSLVEIKRSYTLKNSEEAKTSEESLTDDDIVNYYLEQLIDKFREQHYRLVFVLDELDKIEGSELDSLLKEMKPWLVRGAADFILVAGQSLTMQYYQARSADDAILSSLFSKIVHIHLLPAYTFEHIFTNFLFAGIATDTQPDFRRVSYQELTPAEADEVTALRNKYIYRSRRLPRAFMNLIRQDLRWNGQEAYLETTANGHPDETEKQRLLEDFLEKVSLTAAVSPTARDFLATGLYRLSLEMVCVTDPAVKIPEKKSEYPELQPLLDQYIRQLYEQAESWELIKILRAPLVTAVASDERDNTAKTPTESMDEALITFRTDFLVFMKQLMNLHPALVATTPSNLSEHSLRYMLDGFRNAGLITFGDISSPLFDQQLSHFESQPTNVTLYKDLQTAFQEARLYPYAMLESLYRSLTSRILDNVFVPPFIKEEVSASIQTFATWLYRSADTASGPDVLVRYQFIEGPVAIPNEELGKLISYLSEYNLQTEKGNYLIQIIFTSLTSFNPTDVEVNSAMKIHGMQKDMASRIRFIVLPVGWQADLGTKLQKILTELVAYSLRPVLDKEKAINASRRHPVFKQLPSINDLIANADDPQKGRWGGQSTVPGRALTATVRKRDDVGSFMLNLQVATTDGAPPLTGLVTFYLNDTFEPNRFTVLAKEGIAKMEGLEVYEAFTVGATCDNNTVRLELDLNELKDIPREFGYDRI